MATVRNVAEVLFPDGSLTEDAQISPSKHEVALMYDIPEGTMDAPRVFLDLQTMELSVRDWVESLDSQSWPVTKGAVKTYLNEDTPTVPPSSDYPGLVEGVELLGEDEDGEE